MPAYVHRIPVRSSPDLTRILALSRRPPTDLDSLRAKALQEIITDRLTNGKTTCSCQGRCIKQLKPIQAWSLYEASIANGLLGAVGVGSGKTILNILCPMVIKDCRLAVLLIPPSLKEQLWREYQALSQHFKVPSLVMPDSRGVLVPGAPVLRVVPYSMFSRASSTNFLTQLKPDLIIADECHKLKHRQSATSSRVFRYLRANPETRFCAWSGTVTSKSVKDYSHICEHALHQQSPLPLVHHVVDEWALALDPSENPAPPGALLSLCQNGETLHQGFYRRLTETFGVVATKQGSIDASLFIYEKPAPKVPALILQKLKELRSSWTRPDGEELVDALTVARVARELACGFYYRWKFPRKEDPKLIDRWFEVRALWHKELREKLKTRREHLDSPLLCTNAAQRAYSDYKGPLPVWRAEYYQDWQGIKDQVQPETEAVWLDAYLANDCAQWGLKNRGLIWYEHDAFGEKVSTLSSLPKHGGGIGAEERILSEKGDRSLVVSIHAHGTGRDGLQRLYNEQLVANPPSNGALWEQLLGRLHRLGQEADEVITHMYRHTEEMKDSIDSALRQARYIQDTLGTNQKLILASYDFSIDS